jgi:hypothetical protein
MMPEQPTLFPEPKHVVQERQKAARSVALAACPSHPYDYRLVGVVLGANHLHWRAHRVPVNGPRKWRWCTASDATLCAVPARNVPGHHTPTCPCQEKVRVNNAEQQ